jgi:histidinol-phosphate aminotransferase
MSLVRSEIAAMQGYIPGEQPQGGKWIKLNTNENPYQSTPAVQRAVGTAIKLGLSKYPDPSASAFRARASEVYGVPPDWIMCGNGSDDILTIVTRTFVGQGELLRLPYPSYVLYKTLAELQGAPFEEISFKDDWSLGDDFTVPHPKLKLACIANPNSPSGTVIPPAGIKKLADQLTCQLLVDEAYADFASTNCIELVKQNERIMVSRTLSKSYALAGLRFGFIIAQPQIIAELNKVRDSYNCDSLSIAGATAAIDDQAWLADNRGKILATRTRMTAELRSLGFAVLDSEANFVWCTHPAHKSRDLYERLKSAQVLVRYMNYPRWGDGLRITVGTDEQIDALLMLIKDIVK